MSRRTLLKVALNALPLVSLPEAVQAASDSPVVNSTEFITRRQSAFAALRGSPLTFRYVSPNPNFVRPQSYDLLSYALRCFWNQEDIAGANRAVAAHNSQYLDPVLGKTRMFDGDSFYWPIGLLFECIELFGNAGSMARALLSADNERTSLEMLKYYADAMSTSSEYATSTVWSIRGSENHHVQRSYCLWHTAKLLNSSPEFRNLLLADGQLPVEHLKGWTAWFKYWIREHAKRCTTVEYGGDEYNATTLKGLYVLAAFTDDLELNCLAQSFIEVFWSTWVQEHTQVASSAAGGVDFVRGGAKARIYPEDALLGRETSWIFQQHDAIQQLCYYYSGRGQGGPLEADAMMLLAAGIEPHDQIIARISESNEVSYEVTERIVGMFDDQKYALKRTGIHYVDTKPARTFLKYSYCTPEFTMGSVLCPALREWEWTMISSQNRWAGVTCMAHIDARVGFYADPTRNLRSYNSFWSVQKLGTMIAQKLHGDPLSTDGRIRYSKDAGPLRVWVAAAGRSSFDITGSWAFVTYGNCWVGVGFPEGGFAIDIDAKGRGLWLRPLEEHAPIVIEVSRAVELSFAQFKQAILSNKPATVSPAMIAYTSIGSDLLELPLNGVGLPRINGVEVNLEPVAGRDGPYLQSEWGSGKVVYRRHRSTIVYDFDKATRTIS